MSQSTDETITATYTVVNIEAIVGRLRALLAAHQGEHHVVVMQDYPDPDAIACGLAHQHIASEFDIQCTLLYAGQISHQQNRALVNLLDISLVRYQEGNTDLSRFDGAIFVDTQGTNVSLVPRLVEAGVPPLVIVDHHERQAHLQAQFEDIRPVAACATMYVDYLRNGLLSLSPDRHEDEALATALMHGLQTETQGFVNAGRAEFQSAAWLSNFYDPAVLAQILSQSRSKTVMALIQRALQNREIRDNFSISGIGYLRSGDRDAIPQAADFLLTEENVHTAIVFGLVAAEDGTETVIGSLRTVKVTIDPDELLKSAFGRGQEGKYFGGGKRTAGGFEIPVGFLSGNHDDEFRQLKWQVYNAQVRQRFFEHLGMGTQ
ncbi:MAG: bifunctional oligoribonuclease/PAP phosphatase NrnA [Anaerolineales bacterium]|nr:bifunctional oligoribonuclease/PAP phosphatase NrnA [Anaerolineales bacterium]MCB9128880.1 bifunctional oligoribonuclease/PAP phosphatase NrnA [Ardenticatenales bacterium]MCB9172862.1 bifunctional oligoribonuclease/PAP phosphatase NrnA [Ardenticatenales bacterium]